GADQLADAILHLAGGLVGECHRQNLPATRLAGGEDVGDASGQNPRLAGAGPGENQQRPFSGFHRLALFGVQPSEIARFARGELGRDGALRAMWWNCRHTDLTNLFLFSCRIYRRDGAKSISTAPNRAVTEVLPRGPITPAVNISRLTGDPMNKSVLLAAIATGLLASAAVPASAQTYFNRIASFPVALNTPDIEAEENSAEIITATEDGMTLVYSNALLGGVGFIDITDPANPQPGGFVELEGGPTSVSVIGNKALVSVDTTDDFTAPTGYLAVVDIETLEVEAQCDLGGQPDAIARNADGSLIAISMENQRNEDFIDCVIPQLPSGNVTFLDVTDGAPDCGSLRVTELAGLADVAGEDAEPEYTDFNAANERVVTLQENNHIVAIDGNTGEVTSHFSAGSVDLAGIDAEEDGRLSFTDSAQGVVREPDAVQWLDEDRFVIANEGDYEGGSRGFTIFNKDGTELYESGVSMEYISAQLGHYPEGRSDAKGIEPEGMEVGFWDDETLIFVNQER